MLRSTALALTVAGAALMTIQTADAQTSIYTRNYAYVPGPVYQPVNPPPAVYAAPPVGGAVIFARPADCGVYFYWDGTECVDARSNPPALDRERPIR